MILKELAAADQNRNMHNAPAPINISPHNSVNAVNLNLSYLNALVNAKTDDGTTAYGYTYTAISNSESSADKSHCGARPKDKKKEKSTRRQSTSRVVQNILATYIQKRN